MLDAESLVEASAAKGERLLTSLAARLDGHPAVGEVRGRGLLVGVELVVDRETRAAFPRAAKVTERVVAAARERGVLVYSGTGNADGVDGDTILLGPPFVVTDEQLDRIVDVIGEAIDVAVTEVGAAAR
jgi:adenosylmethionine-8-amino-7-oxononanoate aminotransferase